MGLPGGVWPGLKAQEGPEGAESLVCQLSALLAAEWKVHCEGGAA